ncbi:YidC/Oxa1 family membrane protein insertase [Candidatus Parcubacteria bacterium]|nr:YidC/Oxa1 family membrane protein insertase [Patescibacteria group bacterium]MCG2693746.1 YidC/Oxa1 family membrane protein insertase [Candidatus Parcubacteria bacterium]
MLSHIWTAYLFKPVFNILIYLYNEVSGQNLGIAVIYLTVLIRLLLLPFSVISVWRESFYKKISVKIEKIALAYKNDEVLQNQEIREFLKTHRINPWSKAIVLGVQALTLVLLYQVFLGGIKGTKLDLLYSWVERPDFVKTMFLGFDLGVRSFIWPAIVAVVLFLEITMEQRKKRALLLNSDIVYKFFFPLAVFAFLSLLPMVKSLFVLTSLVFSAIVVGGIKSLFNAMDNSSSNTKKPKIITAEED